MRFLRLSLRHFRGVEHAEVAFRPTGVTVIAGPNEIGKSSLAEAVDLLFDYLDSSTAQAVRAVQPVDRDEGSQVELEFEAGPYRATYLKSFNRGKRTELTVHAPRPESVTGRAAHERVQEILGETVDLGLWKALRIQQETPLSYPDLDGHRSLAAALDRAAGQARSGDAEASLFEAARAEYEVYHTPGGQPRAPLRDAATALERAEVEVGELETALRAVERDVEASARLDRQIAEGEAQLQPLRRTAAEREADLARLERQERELAALESRLVAAESAHREAALRRDGRREMVERVERARVARAELEEAISSRAPDIARRREEEARARAALEEARGRARGARASAELAERDLAFRRGELDHAQLSERLGRVREAESRAQEAEAELEKNPVSAGMLEEVRAGHLAVERARAAAEAGSPRLLVEALRDLTLETGEGEARLPAGERWEARVHEAAELVLGDLARLRVEPAAGSRGPVEALRQAEERYASLLERAGAETLEEAARRERERSEAERVVAGRDRIVRENLRDLSRDQLEQKVARLAERIARYPQERASGIPLSRDFDAAQDRLREARAGSEAAARTLEEATAAAEQARGFLAAVEKARDEDGARLAQQGAQLAAEEQALIAAREATPDEALDRAAGEAAVAVEEVGGEAERARRALAAVHPEGIRLHASNARAAVDAAERRLAEGREARIAVRARLEAAGEKGLDEALSGARITLHRARQAKASVERRAAAARLLFETLRDRREEARRGYVRPLTEKIEGLGRHVFGPDFRVELDGSLAVSHRTLGGRTVPFEGLSGGAREQISILARLACALTVAGEGGVPLVFDDALGNSDAGRLEALGAVLALAGRSCQVVVLTCAPERYRHVGSAEVVTLNGAAPA